MFVRIVRVKLKPESINESIDIYENSVIPAAKSVDGYEGGYLLVDREKQRGVSIAIWENKEKMVASQESGFLQAQFAKFGEQFAEQPLVEEYDVALQVDV